MSMGEYDLVLVLVEHLLVDTPGHQFFCFVFLVTLELSTCMQSPRLRNLPGSVLQDRVACTDLKGSKYGANWSVFSTI